MRPLFSVMLLALLVAACGGDRGDLPASYVRIDIDKSEPRRLLTYYFGGYISPAPADPFEAGLLVERGRSFYLDVEALQQNFPAAGDHSADANGDGLIDWDEFRSFIGATYYEARAVPEVLDSLKHDEGFGEGEWMEVGVHGVMTTALRRIFVRRASVRDAVARYRENDERLLYPEGTTFIAEHELEDGVAETTIMRKRPDGFWDFAVYDAAGHRTSATSTPPKRLEAPVQCVGCHFGNRLFEPERSFPAEAGPGPHGPRRLYVDDSLRDMEVVKYFDEHSKRSDRVLGLYGTLYVTELRRARDIRSTTNADTTLLKNLGL